MRTMTIQDTTITGREQLDSIYLTITETSWTTEALKWKLTILDAVRRNMQVVQTMCDSARTNNEGVKRVSGSLNIRCKHLSFQNDDLVGEHN
jgi:hypothetical protein